MQLVTAFRRGVKVGASLAELRAHGCRRVQAAIRSGATADAFWSRTIYNADDKMLVANSLNCYKVGSDTKGVTMNPDGSFTVLIQHDRPADTSNWLPAPTGNFKLSNARTMIPT